MCERQDVLYIELVQQFITPNLKKIGHWVKHKYKNKLCKSYIQLNIIPKKRYFMFILLKLIVFANIHSFWIGWLQQVPKKLGQGHVYHWVTSPFLLITLSKCLRTKGTNYWRSFHSFLIYSFSCPTVRCRILLFTMHTARPVLYRHSFTMK